MKTKKSKCNACTSSVPPDLKYVKIYFLQKGLSENEAIDFFEHYRRRHWKTNRGCPVKNWMTAANNWIWSHRKPLPLTIAMKLNIQVLTQFPTQQKPSGYENKFQF